MISNPASLVLHSVSSTPRADVTLEAAPRFAGYQLLEKWGEGPIGEVHHALRLDTKQSVALKRIHPPIARDPGFVRAFFQAATRARRLTHPVLPEIVEVGEHLGQLFLATTAPQGRSLTQLLAYLRASGVGLEASIAADLIRQLAEALAEAHSARSGDGSTAWPLIHGNLKPSNVLILPTGELRLLDLGTSVAASLNPEGPLVWLSRESIRFMAPELTRGAEPDSRSDVYALGLLFFELLTLEPVIEAALPLEMLRQVGEVDLLERLKLLKVHGVSPELIRVLQGALQRRPRARFPDAGALAAALGAAIQQLVGLSPQPLPVPARVWTELLRELSREEGQAQREAFSFKLAPGDDEVSLEPWSLSWFEDATTSARGWRQGVEQSESARAVAAKVTAASMAPRVTDELAPVTGIMLLDDDAELDDDWEVGLQAVPLLAARGLTPSEPLEISGDDIAYEAAEPMVQATSPLVLQAEELEDSSVPGDDDLEPSELLGASPIPLGVDSEDFGRALQALETQGASLVVEEEPSHSTLTDELDQLRMDDDEPRPRSRRRPIAELGVSEESHRTVFIPDSASLIQAVEEVSGADVLVGSEEEFEAEEAAEAAEAAFEDETDPSEVTDRRQEISAEAAEQAVRAVEAAQSDDGNDTTPAEITDKFVTDEGFASLHHEVTNPAGIAPVPAFDAPAAQVSVQALAEVSQALRASELAAVAAESGQTAASSTAASEPSNETSSDDASGTEAPREGGRRRGGDTRRTNTRRTRNSGIVATTDSVTGSGVVATTGIEVRSSSVGKRGSSTRTTSPALGRPGEALERGNPSSSGEAGLSLAAVSEAFASLEDSTESTPTPASIAFAETTAESLFFGSSLFVPPVAELSGRESGPEPSHTRETGSAPETGPAEAKAGVFSPFSSELVPTEEILGQSMVLAVAELQRSGEPSPSSPLALHTLEAQAVPVTQDEPAAPKVDEGGESFATEAAEDTAEAFVAVQAEAAGEAIEAELAEHTADGFTSEGIEMPSAELASIYTAAASDERAAGNAQGSEELATFEAESAEADALPEVAEVYSSTPPRVPGLFSDLPTETFFNQALPDSSMGLSLSSMEHGFELGREAPPTEQVLQDDVGADHPEGQAELSLDPSELPFDEEVDRFSDRIPARAMEMSADLREPPSPGHSPYPVRSHETTVEISIVDDGTFEEEVEGEVEALSVSDSAIPELMGAPITRVDLATEQAKADGRLEEIPEKLQLGEQLEDEAAALEIETVGAEEVIEVGDSSELDDEEATEAEVEDEGMVAEAEDAPVSLFAERSVGTGSRNEAAFLAGQRSEGEGGSAAAELERSEAGSSGSVVITNPFVASSSSRSGITRMPGERISPWESGSTSGQGVNLANAGRLEPGARITVPTQRTSSSFFSSTASSAATSANVSTPRAPAWLRPVSRRPSLRDGSQVAGRYRVEGLLMEFPERSIYAVTELVQGPHRHCYVCGFAGNEAEDHFCQKCGSSLLDRQLTLSMRWEKRRVERDCQLLGREVQHPGIARIYDQFLEGGRLFRVLDLVTADISAGILLSQLAGPLEIPMLGEIGVQAAIALHALHEQGINCPFLSEDHLFLRSEQVQLFDMDLDEVMTPGALTATMRIKDVMVLARVLVQYLPPGSTELVEVLRAATEGRIPNAEDFAIAIHEASGLPESSLFPGG
ncbi:MAG: protein kinase domain-containing protein [Myxococcota bacterium]